MAAGLARTRWGSLSAPPDTLAAKRGPTSTGRGGEGEGRGGERERKGKGGEGKEGRDPPRVGAHPPFPNPEKNLPKGFANYFNLNRNIVTIHVAYHVST